VAIQVLIVLTFHQDAAGVGLVNAARWFPCLLFGLVAGGIGGLAGSLVATRLGARFGANTAISWTVFGAEQRALVWLDFLRRGQLLLGLSLGAENANEMGYWQAVTPDALQGRVNATRRSINRAMLVLAAPAGGFLGDAIGYRPMLWALRQDSWP
jgi:hypothetical protein